MAFFAQMSDVGHNAGMDDIVKKAMGKWPNVPACAGWLGLDARGHWFMRDDAAQRQGPFPLGKGAQLQHEGLAQFIGRNYARDETGRWFFQNGPQRVFVELEAAPWILRVQDDGSLLTHTGLPATMQESWEDETGRLYLATEHGLGLVHSMDMLALSNQMEREMERDPRWVPKNTSHVALQQRFEFVLSPEQQSKESA